MTNQKPCLPGCRCKCGDLWEHHGSELEKWDPESHAPACPNAPKPPEAPKVKRQRACRCVAGFDGYCPQHGSSEPFLDPRERPAPAPEAKGSEDVEAEITVRVTENGKVQSVAAWERRAVMPVQAQGVRYAQYVPKTAYLALRAEVERLKATLEQKEIRFSTVAKLRAQLAEKESAYQGLKGQFDRYVVQSGDQHQAELAQAREESERRGKLILEAGGRENGLRADLQLAREEIAKLREGPVCTQCGDTGSYPDHHPSCDPNDQNACMNCRAKEGEPGR